MQNQQTPLHKAAKGGHMNVVELLVREGAQVDSVDEVSSIRVGTAVVVYPMLN